MEEGKQTSASDGPAAVVDDRISDLHDDILLHVLSFVPDARDLVQTAAVSRRWRHLWMQAPVLRFSNTDEHPRRINSARFSDFIHAVLARRTVPVDQLVLHVTEAWPGRSRLNLWLEWAMQHVVDSFDLSVSLPWDDRFLSSDEELAVVRREHLLLLPERSRTTKISLSLRTGVLGFPSTVAFHELTEMSLSSVSFLDDDEADQFFRLLSSTSCFPRLRKLRLVNPEVGRLRLHSSVLEFLELDRLYVVMHLDIDAPRLSTLTVDIGVLYYPSATSTVNAPALKEIKCTLNLDSEEFHNTLLIMQRCTSVERHIMLLHLPKHVNLNVVWTVKAYLPPPIPHVRDLTLTLISGHTNNFVASVATILTLYTGLQHLRLDIHKSRYNYCRPGKEDRCTSCHVLPEEEGLNCWLEDYDVTVSLEHLREVEMVGLSGRDCHDMAQLLLATAPALQRMTVSALAEEAGDEEEDAPPSTWMPMVCETSLPWDRGEWTAASPYQYEWIPTGPSDLIVE